MGYWLMDTAGVGSIIVLVVGFSLLVAYVYMLRWIKAAPPDSPLPAAENPEGEEAEAGGEGQ
jgi:hypothetical protein